MAPISYQPPIPLRDLHILDLLELTGSQPRAGQALAVHPSTVCRTVQMMREQFRLQPSSAVPVCRQGTNESLHHLRLSYRAHRVMGGLLRIATDVLHQDLLRGMGSVQTVPPRFRPADQWAALVSHALIDGAIVSSWCHGSAGPWTTPPHWPGLVTLPLGSLPLALVAVAADAQRVLLPRRAVVPRLHQLLESHGVPVEVQPVACQEPEAWWKRMRDRQLALPLCPGLMGRTFWRQQGLRLLTRQPPLEEELWLLLPRGRIADGPLARECLRRLRQRVRRSGRGADPGEASRSGCAA